MRRSSAVASTVLVVLALTLAVPARGNAQAAATGTLDLRSQTTFRTPDQPFTLALRIRTTEPASSLEVAVGIFRRITSGRSEYAQTLQGRFRSRLPVQTVPVPMDTLTPDADGIVQLPITPTSTHEGVYPVRVELRERDTGDVLDSFVTHMVTLPTTGEADPLDVALVVPVHAPPAIKPDGNVALDDSRAAGLGDLAVALAAHASLPLTLAPTGETIEALATSPRSSDRDTIAMLAGALGSRQLVTSTYVPTDMRALLDAGLSGEANAELARGRKVVERYLGAAPSATVRIVDDRLNADALAGLEAQGVERVVAPESTLYPVPSNTTLTSAFHIATRRAELHAAAADTDLAAAFTRDGNPVLSAAHVLADLAVLWFDLPGQGVARRGVVMVPPRSWTPDARFEETLFSGLQAARILEPVTLDTFFQGVGLAPGARGKPPLRTFQAPDGASGIPGASVRAARGQLEAFASSVAPDNPTVARLERTLLGSLSSDLRPRTRTSYLTGVNHQIQLQLDRIQMPHNRSITLTARNGEIPITVTNHLPYPVKAIVEVSSDALVFSSNAKRPIDLTRQNTTETFSVRARGSGSFPLLIRVTSPEGSLVLAQSRFTVRSTAVSGVGVGLSVGAAAFLFLWWASHLRTTRRATKKASDRAHAVAAVPA